MEAEEPTSPVAKGSVKNTDSESETEPGEITDNSVKVITQTNRQVMHNFEQLSNKSLDMDRNRHEVGPGQPCASQLGSTGSVSRKFHQL